MRVWILLAGLYAAPALASDLAEMNAVSQAWDRYAELSSQDRQESADLLAASSLRHFGFLRDAALYASPEQLRRIPASDRLMVYLLRASQDSAALRDMDGRAVAMLCIAKGWAGVDVDDGETPLALSHVTLLGDLAVGEIGPPTETQYQFGPDFVKQDGGWKYRYESMVADTSVLMERSFKESGMGGTQLLEYVIAELLGDGAVAPSLAALDRTPLDDGDARRQLNENWPDYRGAYRHRFAAIGKKAEEGDSFAQYVIGALMIDGEVPDFIPRNEASGVEWLEKASDGGNAAAAWRLFGHLFSDPALYSEARSRQALPHLQRAAAAANPSAMEALGSFYFEGVAGLPRDCRRAAEWQARAEEAGLAGARNQQVWTWATCPIREQRDPAKALQLVQYMVRNKDGLPWDQLDTVAAAFAANRQFDQAVAYQQLAIDKLSASDKPEKARTAALKRLKRRLDDYRNGRDYVQDYNTLDELRAGNL